MPTRYRRKPKRQTLDKRVRKIAKSVIAKQSELKYFDTTLGVSADISGSLGCLSLVPQGDTDITRDGDQLYATSMQIKGYLNCTDATNQFRIIVFKYKPEATPINDDILASATKGSINYVNAPYHHDGRSQFVVLSDRMYSLALTNTPKPHFNLNIKLNNKIKYSAGGTTGYNQIWYMIISDSAVATHPYVQMTSRLRFRDF